MFTDYIYKEYSIIRTYPPKNNNNNQDLPSAILYTLNYNITPTTKAIC